MSVLGPLDLGDADTTGFKPLDARRYPAVVFAMSNDAVKNTTGRGSLPAGTLMVKVQFRITEEIDGSTNRRVFANYYPVPPKGHDKQKAQKMKGMFVNLLVALDEDEEKIRSKGYEPDYEELIGRPCVVVVGKEQKKTSEGEVIEDEWNNPVKGVKHIDTWTGAASSDEGGLL